MSKVSLVTSDVLNQALQSALMIYKASVELANRGRIWNRDILLFHKLAASKMAAESHTGRYFFLPNIQHHDGTLTRFSRVQSVTCSKLKAAIFFLVEEIQWNEAFQDIHFSFGHTNEPLELYSNQRTIHQRRQESTDPTPVGALASSLIPSEADPSATSVSIDLSHEGAGPDWFPAIKTTGPQLPIEINCKDCQTRGSLQLSQGEWELNLNDLDDIDSFSDIFKVGFVQFSIKDFLAHVELQVVPSIEGSTSLALFSLPIPGVTGFTVSDLELLEMQIFSGLAC